MALINIFKKDEGSQSRQSGAKAKPAKKVGEVKIAAQKTGKRSAHHVAGVLKQAHITEKAARLSENNQYVFQIMPRANKSEVAKAVESYYNVDVIKVNITKVPGKRHRRAKGISQDADMRKAIVKIKAGQKIELLPR